MNVLILKGLPGSGKSTYARKLLADFPGKYKRINKDDLRAMVDDGRWHAEDEKLIVVARDRLLSVFLEFGKDVIIDDTNLDPWHEKQIKGIARKFGATVEVKFFDVPLEECIERDKKRTNPIGSEPIIRMHNKYLKGENRLQSGVAVPVQYDPNLPDAIICDIDGTLALKGDRSPYDHSRCEEDSLNEPVWRVVGSMLLGPSRKLIFVSGREHKYREQTVNWLKKNGIPTATLLMRRTNDHRRDDIVKKAIYDSFLRGKYNILCVFDDRQRVVDMWREQGLTCLQVAEGNF